MSHHMSHHTLEQRQVGRTLLVALLAAVLALSLLPPLAGASEPAEGELAEDEHSSTPGIVQTDRRLVLPSPGFDRTIDQDEGAWPLWSWTSGGRLYALGDYLQHDSTSQTPTFGFGTIAAFDAETLDLLGTQALPRRVHAGPGGAL